MPKFLIAKKLGSLHPVDEAGEDALRKIAQGELVQVEMRKPRNLQHHRLFWALMSLVWQNIDDRDTYPDVESLVTEVKIITGHYDRRDIEYEGRRYPVLTPKSISFAAMDQLAFDAFFQKVCDWIAESVLPGITSEELKDEVESMTGASIGA